MTVLSKQASKEQYMALYHSLQESIKLIKKIEIFEEDFISRASHLKAIDERTEAYSHLLEAKHYVTDVLMGMD